MAEYTGSKLIQIGYKPDLLKSGLSAWLDHFRWMAALAVVLVHLREMMFPNFEGMSVQPHLSIAQKLFFFIARFGTQAVVVFFVISGLLVGGSVLRQVKTGNFQPRAYVLARISRLGVVLVPAIVFSVALQNWNYSISCNHPDSWMTIVGNLLSLQNFNIVDPLCNNHPLWSLSSEAWFYLIWPPLLLLASGKARSGLVVVLVGLLLLGVVGWKWDQFNPFFGLVLWLTGLLPWFVTLRIRPIFPGLLLAVVLVLSRMSFFGTLATMDIVLALSFAMLLSVDPALWPRSFARLGHGLAAFSYSLYLVHMPVVQAIGAFLGKGAPIEKTTSYLTYWGCVALIVAIGWAFGALFENRTDLVRNWLYRRAGGRRPVPSA